MYQNKRSFLFFFSTVGIGLIDGQFEKKQNLKKKTNISPFVFQLKKKLCLLCFISQTAEINNNIDINIDFLKNHHSLNVFLAER